MTWSISSYRTSKKAKWKPYLIKGEAFFEANAIENSATKRALLVAALSTHTVETLAGKLSPRASNSLTYEKALATLSKSLDPKKEQSFRKLQIFQPVPS